MRQPKFLFQGKEQVLTTHQKRSVQTLGIILARRKIGEFDDIITLYSPTLGKIQAKAKGARKLKNSFCSQLQILNICHFQLHQSNSNFLITQAIIEENHKKLRQNLEASLVALFILEIFQKTTVGDDAASNENLFDLLTKTLKLLEKSKENFHLNSLEQAKQKVHQGLPSHYFLILERFKIRLLQDAGALPDLSSCHSCQKKWTKETKTFFDHEGRLTCCIAINKSMMIDFNVMKLINFLLRYDTSLTINLREREKQQLKTITDFFLTEYTKKDLHSEKILRQILSMCNGKIGRAQIF